MVLLHRVLVSVFALGCLESATAQIVLHEAAGAELIDEHAKVETIAQGLKFCEGPVWLAAEQKLVFSDIPACKLLQWSAELGVREFAISEQSNGNTLDLQGRLISCQHQARNVVRREPDGALTVLVDRYDSKLLNSPNDVAVCRDGTVWFTDPTYGLTRREREQAGNFVYRLDPASGALAIVQRDFDQPNGICFSPDHRRLYIADSGSKQRIGAFPVENGTLGEVLFWIEGGADGMRCDVRGNLYATARDGIAIFAPTGRLLVTVPLPAQPTNCAFGGADGKTLFVTARALLCRVAVLVEGAPVPPSASKAAPSPVKAGGEPVK